MRIRPLKKKQDPDPTPEKKPGADPTLKKKANPNPAFKKKKKRIRIQIQSPRKYPHSDPNLFQ